MKIATSVHSPPSFCLRETLQQLVPKPAFNLGKSKFYQNHLITHHDPAASLQKQLPSGAFLNSLLHLSQQHQEATSTLFTRGAFSLHTLLQVHPSLSSFSSHSFFHTIPKVFLALPSSGIYVPSGVCWLCFHREFQGPANTSTWHKCSEEQMSHTTRHVL